MNVSYSRGMDIAGEIHYDWPLESTLEVRAAGAAAAAAVASMPLLPANSMCEGKGPLLWWAGRSRHHQQQCVCHAPEWATAFAVLMCRAVLCCALAALLLQACEGADVGLVFVGSSMVELKKTSEGDFKPATEGEGLGKHHSSCLHPALQ